MKATRHTLDLFVSILLLLLAALPAPAATVTAGFNSAADVPVTSATYMAKGNSVNFTLSFAPPVGTNLTVVNNTGMAFIQGTFANLTQGQLVNLTFNGVTYPFVANYFGGTGNDLVLQWANTRLLSWGYNAQGQLGNQSTTQSNVPVPVLMSGVLADKAILAAGLGSSHNLALATDGTLTGWGDNGFGQLGNGGANSNVPTLVNQTGVLAGKRLIAVAAGSIHSLALGADGTVAAWGYNNYGQLGYYTTTSWSTAPVLVDRTGALAGKTVVAIAAGGYFNLALCADGSLVAWGENNSGQFGNGTTTSSQVPVAIPLTGALAGKSVVAIATAYDHSLALCADGTLAAWGSNTYGQLGNNTTTNSSVPVAVVKTGVLVGKSVTAIDLGINHAICLCSDGTLATWGYNNHGQLGNNTTTNSSVPVLVTKTGVLASRTPVAVRARSWFSFALCADGSVASWGDNTNGQLGNNSTTQSTVPVLASTAGFRAGERFVALPAGTQAANSLAITALPPPPQATTLAASGIVDTDAVLNGSVSANGGTTASVSFEYGLTAAYGTTVVATPASLTGTATTAVGATAAELTPGTTYHYRVVASNTNGVTKGADMTFTTTTVATLAGLTLDSGTLVPGFDPLVSSYEVTLPNTAVHLRVSPMTQDPAAAVTVNGVAAAAGAAVTVELAEGLNSVAVVVTAADGSITHTYTIKVMRWPTTYLYQAATDVPVTVGGCIASGSTATLALGFAPATGAELTVVKNTGLAFIQGTYDNLAQGQLVQLTYNNAIYYFVVNYYGGSGNDLVLQWAFTKIYAWGYNSNGAYGTGNNTSSAVPLAVAPAGILAGKTLTMLALGSDHTLALCSDGTLATWGYNNSGQLGNGGGSASYLPVAVTSTGVLAGKRVIAITACSDHCLVLCSDGMLASWGANSYGVLGSGSGNSSSVPVAVSTAGVLAGKTVVAIATGPSHSLALCADGTLASWGYNNAGQLGDGTTTNSTVPVAVIRTGVLAGKTVTAIAAGASSLALCSDGTVASWGPGWAGLLGTGSTANSSVPVAVGTTGVLAGETVTAIASGYNSNLALCADGTLVAWGYNGMGELGNGNNTDSSMPVIVTGTGVLSGKTPIAIAASYPIYALCADGTFVAWGDNQRSQFGNGTSTTSNLPVAASLASLGSGEKFISLASGSTATRAMALAAVPLSGNCDLASLGLGSAILDPVFAPGVTAYTARVRHGTPTVIVKPTVADGTAKVTVNGTAVVSGVSGEVIAATPGSTITVRVTAENGTLKTYAVTVREDAALTSLGLSQGPLLPAFSPFVRDYSVSVGTATPSLLVTPVAADPTAAVTVNGTPASAGGVAVPLAQGANTVTVAVTALDGTLVTYQVIVTRAAAVSFTYNSATAVPLTVSAYVATDNTATLALGYAPTAGTDITVINNTGNEPIVGRFANFAQGQAVGLAYNGTTYRFVANYFGGTGNDLVLQWANTKAYGWGGNAVGQVGDGTLLQSASPTPVTATGVLLGKSIVALAVGGSHSLALCSDGTVAAWGGDGAGQLGDGGTNNSGLPVDITRSGVLAGRKVIAIAAGGAHSLALCEDGMIAAWGQNTNGQLGNGQAYPSGTPVAVIGGGALAGKTVTAICAGSMHSLAMCADGTVVAWGKNSSGQLGDGGTTGRIAPVAVVFSGSLVGKQATAISAGEEHSLVRFEDGTLAAWGSGSDNRLGNGSTAASYVPSPVLQTGALAGKNVTRIAAGGRHNLALCADGVLVAWGGNWSGQLGVTVSSTDPALVDMSGALAGKQVIDIAGGAQHSVALCSDGTLTTWGADISGAPVGPGSSAVFYTPVLVPTAAFGVGQKITSLARGSAGHALVLAATPVPNVSTLAGLTLGGGGLNAAFSPGTTAYGGWVPSGTTAVTVTPTASDPLATLTVNGTPVASGATSAEIPRSPGNQTITIRVTSQSGQTTTSYVLTVRDDSSLASLSLSAGTLLPAFSPVVKAYTAYVPTATTAVSVTAAAAAPGATAAVNGTPVAPGTASVPVSLAQGSNSIPVQVSAPDGSITNYTLTVIRQAPVNFTFKSSSAVPVTSSSYTATGNTAGFALGYAPTVGTILTVVKNTGQAMIKGTFDNLTQGQIVKLAYGGYTYFFVANYFGGTGNDLVLQWANTRMLGWGNNSYGQLGRGSLSAGLVPASVVMTGVLAGKTPTTGVAGGSHSLALCSDGTVAAWGYNAYGQLGNGSTSDGTVPVWVNRAGVLAGKWVIAVAAGDSHTLALCSDGTLAAWGANSGGQLGNNKTTNSSVPVLVDKTGVLAGKSVVAIAAGSFHSLALCADGTLAAWGNNSSGQLGNNRTTASSVPVWVDRSGALAGQTVTAIAAGGNFSMGLCADGSAAGWGDNSYGQLGNGSTTNSAVPVAADRTGVLYSKPLVAISAGTSHCLALTADGMLVTWGGYIGLTNKVPKFPNITGQLAAKTLSNVSAGYNYDLVLCADGSMATWGYNESGQLGNNTTTWNFSPAFVNTSALAAGERVIKVANSLYHNLALVAMPSPPVANTLAATGINPTSAVLNGEAHGNGTSATVTFEYGLTQSYGTSVAATPATASATTLTSVSKSISGLVVNTTYHYRVVATNANGTTRGDDMTFTTHVLSNNANLAALGLSGGALLPGFDALTTGYIATAPFGTSGVTVTPVTEHAAAVVMINGVSATSGTASAAISLAVGNTTLTTRVTAEDGITTKSYVITVTRLPENFVFNSASDVPVTANGFAAGGYPANVILNYAPVPGTVLTMVNNTGLGFIHGTFSNLAQGQRIGLTFNGATYDFVVNYHGGSGNDLVLQWADTQVVGWGSNNYGQLGDATTTRRLLPTAIDATGVLAGKTITAVAEGYLHSLALCSDGTLAAWGYNVYGQLGNNSAAPSSMPVAVDRSGALAGKTVIAIAAGPFHNLALCADGTVVAWGYNNYGQLGTGDMATRRVPVVVTPTGALAGKQVVAVAAGAYHSFALCADGTLVGWGFNDDGELSDGTTTGRLVPVAVNMSGALAGKQIAALSAGQYHTLALCTDATLLAWGHNNRGQLGNNSTASSKVPVAIGSFGALSGKPVVAVRASGAHSLALCADGTLAAWGWNQTGQLGAAGITQSNVPVAIDMTAVTAGTSLTQIGIGGSHSLALCANGTLAAWGDNASGQLGTNSTTPSTVPVAVDISGLAAGARWMGVASGSAAQHNLAVAGLPSVSLTPHATGLQSMAVLGSIQNDSSGLIACAFGLDGANGRLPQGQWLGGRFVMRFSQPAGIIGITYGAEWSATLLPGSWLEVPDTGTAGEHLFSLPVDAGPHAFLRLKVTGAASP